VTARDGSAKSASMRSNVRHDPGREVVLYSLSEQDSISGEWHNLCEPIRKPSLVVATTSRWPCGS
jgi:hypothetical protein